VGLFNIANEGILLNEKMDKITYIKKAKDSVCFCEKMIEDFQEILNLKFQCINTYVKENLIYTEIHFKT
jgi:hypothetical protein